MHPKLEYLKVLEDCVKKLKEKTTKLEDWKKICNDQINKLEKEIENLKRNIDG